MNIIYRISDVGYNKVKPEYVTNENCLRNAVLRFPINKHNWYVIADNVSDETLDMIKKYVPSENIETVSIGHGAGTFNLALDTALSYPLNEIIYFLENDYIHKLNSDVIMEQGFEIKGVDFVSLYDHPDKYIDNGNPFVKDGGEVTKVFSTKDAFWKITNSTTMTFASKVSTLISNEHVFRKWTNSTHPNDFQMFLELYNKGIYIVTPLPGYSTHAETSWLAKIPGVEDLVSEWGKHLADE